MKRFTRFSVLCLTPVPFEGQVARDKVAGVVVFWTTCDAKHDAL